MIDSNSPYHPPVNPFRWLLRIYCRGHFLDTSSPSHLPATLQEVAFCLPKILAFLPQKLAGRSI